MYIKQLLFCILSYEVLFYYLVYRTGRDSENKQTKDV